MKNLTEYINEASKIQDKPFSRKQSLKELHKLFNNEQIDQNETVTGLIDKYCPEGGYVGYECQDQLPHDFQISNETKIDTAMVNVPDQDITYNIDVYKNINTEQYCIHIYNDLTAIYIIGSPMENLKDTVKESLLIEEGEHTELNEYLTRVFKESLETGKPVDDIIDEGIFSGLLGGLAGATVGSSIMKALCKALGIDERGALGNLLTSRVVMGAVGATLGYRI